MTRLHMPSGTIEVEIIVWDPPAVDDWLTAERQLTQERARAKRRIALTTG